MAGLIRFQNVSKRYRIQKMFGPAKEFFAVQNVSFEVKPGETLGIIGSNGAGKTTVLKLIANVTEPTEGDIQVEGRLVPLIELNAGFHSELSGRENVYLNASILGLSNREVRKKFDSIVAYAGLETFIDQPVKKYSSGMFARLGFSVAVHSDPDVLLIDEVLSVGDDEYRRKCMESIKAFQKKQVAIIFVSHNLSQVKDICSKAILLDRGKILQSGSPESIISTYSGDFH